MKCPYCNNPDVEVPTVDIVDFRKCIHLLERGDFMSNKIIDEFTDLPVSAQRKAQLRRCRDGLCIICSKPRNQYTTLCDDCGEKHRNLEYQRSGKGKWRNGPIKPSGKRKSNVKVE